MIEHSPGATTFTGPSIDYFRLCTLKHAVSLELKGIKVRRGPVVWRQVKQEFSIKGGKHDVYAWLCAEVERLAPLQEHVQVDR